MKTIKILSLIVLSGLYASCEKATTSEGTKQFSANPDDFKGKITEGTITLDATKVYDLSGSLIIQNGAKLVIPAGTKIEASGGTSSYIAVAQGGKIEVKGTKDKPVIMTSSKSSPKSGDWGGLVLCGKAPTNKGGSKGETASAEVSELTYGGSDASDSSGSIQYLRIEYTGAAFTAEKEFNGLSLFGVGSGTTIDYVQSYKGGDDGFEFFGGTVTAKHLVSTDSEDDGIDFTDGWNGTGSYWFIQNATKAGIEGSNNGNDAEANPKTLANISDVSIIAGESTSGEGAMYFKEGGGVWKFSNIYAKDYTDSRKGALYFKSSEAEKVKSASNLSISGLQLDNTTLLSTFVSRKESDLSGVSQTSNVGAGKGSDVPNWAEGWIKK